MNAKSVAALDAGTVPDIAYADTYDVQTAGKWAFDGKLEDLSDGALGPMKDRFEPVALSTVVPLQRQKAKKKAYYGFPLKQQSMHVQIWKDMLEQAGFKPERHPDQLEGLLVVLVRQGAAGDPQGHRHSASTRVGQPMGVESDRLVPVVLHLHGRLQRQAGRR